MDYSRFDHIGASSSEDEEDEVNPEEIRRRSAGAEDPRRALEEERNDLKASVKKQGKTTMPPERVVDGVAGMRVVDGDARPPLDPTPVAKRSPPRFPVGSRRGAVQS
jgi:hypothetical protein